MRKIEKLERDELLSQNPFAVVQGSDNICKYMGLSPATFFKKHRKAMTEFGCCWKKDKRRSSPIITSPLLINIYWLLRNRKTLYGE